MPLNYDSIGIDSILKKSHEIKFTCFIDGIDSFYFEQFLVDHFQCTYHRLCVAILSCHGEIEPEGITTDDINIASLRSS